jgi:hypothetical protein
MKVCWWLDVDILKHRPVLESIIGHHDWLHLRVAGSLDAVEDILRREQICLPLILLHSIEEPITIILGVASDEEYGSGDFGNLPLDDEEE